MEPPAISVENLAGTSVQLCGLDFDKTTTPMWVVDRKTFAFLAVNDAAVAKYGFSRKQFLKMSILDIRPPEDVPKLLKVALHPKRYDPVDAIWVHRKANGQTFQARITGYAILFEGRWAELVVAREAKRDGGV